MMISICMKGQYRSIHLQPEKLQSVTALYTLVYLQRETGIPRRDQKCKYNFTMVLRKNSSPRDNMYVFHLVVIRFVD